MVLYDWTEPFFPTAVFWAAVTIGYKAGCWFSLRKEILSWRVGLFSVLVLGIVPFFSKVIHHSYYPVLSYDEQKNIALTFYAFWFAFASLIGFFFSFNRQALNQYGHVLYHVEKGSDADSYDVSYTNYCQDWWQYRLILSRKSGKRLKEDPSLEYFFYSNHETNRSLYAYFDRREIQELADYLSLDDEQEYLLNEYLSSPALASLKISEVRSAEYNATHKQ